MKSFSIAVNVQVTAANVLANCALKQYNNMKPSGGLPEKKQYAHLS